jgi:arylsulfatase A-like enzyme
MNRRQFAKRALGLAATMSLPGCALESGRAGEDSTIAAKQPNIILIMADDLGYGDVGCYGNQSIRTPNIDALAKGGMKFTDFHSNAPVCSPTRAALLTGRYQQRCGIDEVVYAKGPPRQTGMPLNEVTFAEVLKKAGYATALCGKWHVGYKVEFNPTKQGFDEFHGYVSGNVDYHSHIDGAGVHDWWKGCEKVPEEGYVTDLITGHAVDFIKRHRDKPFCLYVAHEAPHSPNQGRNDPPQRLAGGKRRQDEGRRRETSEIYKEMIEVMDKGIGRVVSTVKSLGLERKTFIFFCSDNGANKRGSNGPLKGYKGNLWEGGHRVPAIAYWPGRIGPGTVTGETALSMDAFATMVSVAGAALPDGAALDGVDLLPMLTANAKLPRRSLFWRYRKQKAVRKGPWKLLVQDKNVGLYNLDGDIAEEHDLAQSKPGLVTQLQRELSAWERDIGGDAQ